MAQSFTDTESLKDKAADAAGKVKESVQEAGRTVRDKIDESRAPAAEKLSGAASALHERAGNLPGGEPVAGLAHSTADKVQATAEYVRVHNVRDMVGDVAKFVRKHPGQSLLAAAAAGFLIGRSFRNGD